MKKIEELQHNYSVCNILEFQCFFMNILSFFGNGVVLIKYGVSSWDSHVIMNPILKISTWPQWNNYEYCLKCHSVTKYQINNGLSDCVDSNHHMTTKNDVFLQGHDSINQYGC